MNDRDVEPGEFRTLEMTLKVWVSVPATTELEDVYVAVDQGRAMGPYAVGANLTLRYHVAPYRVPLDTLHGTLDVDVLDCGWEKETR